MNGVYARNSIIGLRSRIDVGVRIEDSIIMGSDYFETIEEIRQNLSTGKPHIGIGENTLIKRAIIDKDVRIGKNVRLVNSGGVENKDSEDGSYFIRDGIIIVPKGGTIPDGTQI